MFHPCSPVDGIGHCFRPFSRQGDHSFIERKNELKIPSRTLTAGRTAENSLPLGIKIIHLSFTIRPNGEPDGGRHLVADLGIAVGLPARPDAVEKVIYMFHVPFIAGVGNDDFLLSPFGLEFISKRRFRDDAEVVAGFALPIRAPFSSARLRAIPKSAVPRPPTPITPTPIRSFAPRTRAAGPRSAAAPIPAVPIIK